MPVRCAACLAVHNLVIRNGAASVSPVHAARFPSVVWLATLAQISAPGSALSPVDATTMWAACAMPWLIVERGCLSLCDQEDVVAAWLADYPMAKVVQAWRDVPAERYISMLPAVTVRFDAPFVVLYAVFMLFIH